MVKDPRPVEADTNERGHAFSLPRTESVLLPTRDRTAEYRVDIAMPDGPAPPSGWPSIYLLDASGCFGTCVEAMRRMSRRPDATGVYPGVIIGISSPTGDYDVPRRQRDFTTPRSKSPPDDGTGGAEAFFDFLQTEVKALAGRRFPLDEGRQTLVGHSLAGYFVLWALCHHTTSVQNYAAISPSIWWDREGLFDAASKLGLGSARVLTTIGEWEDALPPWQLASPGSAEVMARREGRQMIPNARELSARLQAVLGEQAVQFSVLADDDHASVVSTSMPRILRLASSR